MKLEKKQLIVIWIWILALVLFIIFVFKWNNNEKNLWSFWETNSWSINSWAINKTIPLVKYSFITEKGHNYNIMITKPIYKDCFIGKNYKYKLIWNNVVEKRIKIEDNLFSCLKNKNQFSKIELKLGQAGVDDKWILHILKSNIKLQIKWFNLSWQK